ncbi:MAG: metallophosphoesterase [Myxococcales bacterium]|nr:metallophosphoesterase [Myxococcales bacterium]USN50810.1 MAG: metallophosphoesterase [Myxococcales bacterium]
MEINNFNIITILFLFYFFSGIIFANTNIVIVGDFGNGDKIISNNKYGQKIVADGMKDYCITKQNSDEKCSFLVGTGDNFYPDGISDNETENLEKFFQNRFMKYYAPLKDLQLPFFMSLGNHDIGDLGWGSTLQRLYTTNASWLAAAGKRIANQIYIHGNKEINPEVQFKIGTNSYQIPFFYLPSPFYSFDLNNKAITLFAIDTMSYPAKHFNDELLSNLAQQDTTDIDKELKKDAISEEQKSENEQFERMIQQEWVLLDEKEKKAKELNLLPNPNNNLQSQALRAAMNNQAKWKIAFGHFPFISHGRHGKEFLSVTESKPIQQLREDLCNNKVDFYLTGHDHHMELSTYKCSDGHVVVVILSGAGSKLDRIRWGTLDRKAENVGYISWGMSLLTGQGYEDPFGKNSSFHWGNGRYFEKMGDDIKFKKEVASQVLGFATLQLDNDGKEAIIRMHVSYAKAKNSSGKYVDLPINSPEYNTACIRFRKAPHFSLTRCDEGKDQESETNLVYK